ADAGLFAENFVDGNKVFIWVFKHGNRGRERGGGEGGRGRGGEGVIRRGGEGVIRRGDNRKWS
ncbi:hypothetical protein QUA51_28330, partial [Microcoleus sp. Pol10_D6]|uniref:hypothetical protein n=1 Tax=Microcoleus sp. Pol10_D6 TaxID=2818875 RepID=UPI002FD45A2E